MGHITQPTVYIYIASRRHSEVREFNQATSNPVPDDQPVRTAHTIAHHFNLSSSRMRVINHNWSATKQRLHPQSVAEISRHSVLSGDRIRQCETSSGARHKDTDRCL